MTNPLRYEISSWNDLPNCLSNNSRDLYIKVSSLLGSDLKGKLIEVKHSLYGTLFATVADAYGTLVDTEGVHPTPLPLSNAQILEQLELYGFYVTYMQQAYLRGAQLLLLMSVQTLGYQMITVMDIVDDKKTTKKVIAFNPSGHSDWLTFGKPVKSTDLDKALLDASAMYVDDYISKYNDMSWTWLTYVATVEDIIQASGRSPV